MRWPWVSRAAFDLAVEERDRLRTQVDRLQEHVVRMDRLDHGVGEMPREPRVAMEPMPKELLAYCNGYADPRIKKALRDDCFKRHRNGEDWTTIKLDVMGRANGSANTAHSEGD